MKRPTRADFQALLAFAVPMASVQVGLMLMGVVDAAMVGRVSAEALAGTALANIWFFAVSTIGMGTIAVLDPVISQAFGAGDNEGIARGLQRGLLIAAIVTVPTSLGLLPVARVLNWAGQPAAVVPLAASYARIVVAGIFPYFAFMALREGLQALGRIRPVIVTIGLANLLNLFLNWVFIFGNLGAPPLGVAGSALATTISRWVMALGLLALTWRHLRFYLRPWRPETTDWAPLRRMFALGLPIGFQILFEYGVFGGVGLLMGRVSAAAVAGHTIALNFAAITFMVPFGIGGAASVLVGRAVGAGRPDDARRVASAALIVGASFMAVAALVFISIPHLLAAAYSPDPAVVAVSALLIPLAGVFQIFDGTQAVALGVLRGIGDTRVPVLVNLAGYYLIGLPVSLWLGFHRGLGPVGLWWGLVVGLMVVALVLVARVRIRLRADLTRLHIDLPADRASGIA